MKTHYSIIYSRINPTSEERLNLGMIMLSETGAMTFRYSSEKLGLLKKLLPDEGSHKLVAAYLKGIENKTKHKHELIDSSKDISASYLSYLSDYSNNLISFSNPTTLDIPFEKSVFEKLYEKWVFKEEKHLPQIREEIGLMEEIRSAMFDRVAHQVNTHVKLDAEKLNFVMFPVTVDMIGRNDQPVLNQFVDFKANKASLRNAIQNYINLIKPFELEEGSSGKFFIVGDEPNKSENAHQHLIWEHLRDSPLIQAEILELVPINEVQRVEEYLNEHDVKPFFS